MPSAIDERVDQVVSDFCNVGFQRADAPSRECLIDEAAITTVHRWVLGQHRIDRRASGLLYFDQARIDVARAAHPRVERVRTLEHVGGERRELIEWHGRDVGVDTHWTVP
jgi:hypothetical protein